MEEQELVQNNNIPETVAVNWHADTAFTVGNLGSLAETMGVEEADKFLDEYSLTRHVRRQVAIRHGRPVVRGFASIGG